MLAASIEEMQAELTVSQAVAESRSLMGLTDIRLSRRCARQKLPTKPLLPPWKIEPAPTCL